MAYVTRRLARGRPYPGTILPGRPVMAPTQWSEMADSANWIVGKGACLVPWCNPAIDVTSGTTRVFRFRIRPRGFAISRVWSVLVRSASATVAATATIRAPATTGTAVTVDLSASSAAISLVVPVAYLEPLTVRSSTEAEISIEVTANVGTVSVEGIDCYEQDRAQLSDGAVDYGIRTETIRPREPIINVANISARGIYDAMANMDARRVGIFHTAVTTNDPYSRTLAALASVTHVPFKIQVPKLNTGATTGSVKWAAYARMATAGGVGGSVNLATSVSLLNDTATVTGTSFAWTATRTVSVGCDDFEALDGFRDDELTVSIAGDATRAVEVATVSIWVDTVA